MNDIQGKSAEGDRSAKVFPVTLMPPDGMNSTSFTQSLMAMLIHDSMNRQHLTSPLFLPTTPLRLADNRNMACRIMLDESDADWLLFIDSDMGFPPDAVDLLLAAADPASVPAIGALCFGMRKGEPDGMGGYDSLPFPTIFDWRQEPPGFIVRHDYARDAITRVAATGAAFLMLHRSVLEAMRAGAGDTWFDRAKLSPETDTMGEDMSFCLRLGGFGLPIYVHTGVRTTHLKPVHVDETFYREQRFVRNMGYAEPGESASA